MQGDSKSGRRLVLVEEGHEGVAIGGDPAGDVIEIEGFLAGQLLFVGGGARGAYVQASAFGCQFELAARRFVAVAYTIGNYANHAGPLFNGSVHQLFLLRMNER